MNYYELFIFLTCKNNELTGIWAEYLHMSNDDSKKNFP